MNIYLIITNPFVNDTTMVELIKSLGATYSFWKNHYLVRTDYNAKKVYEAISTNGVDKTSVLVVKIDNIAETGYWGIMPKELWEWLRNA